MRTRSILEVVFMGLALALLSDGHGVKADSGYLLDRSVIAGGGGGASSSVGSYSLTGAAGQPLAGELSGTGYRLSDGFWVGGASSPSGGNKLYLPLIMR